MGNRESGIGNRESGIGNRESSSGLRSCAVAVRVAWLVERGQRRDCWLTVPSPQLLSRREKVARQRRMRVRVLDAASRQVPPPRLLSDEENRSSAQPGLRRPSTDTSQHAVRGSKQSPVYADALNAKGDRIAAVAFVVCLKRADHTAGSGTMRGIEVAAPSTSVERAA
ncbi:hypothetical protein XarbCFBP7614_17615 [Xanthomonas arboricola]|nr:hypothetical protein XarbCFBP7614_17615 [Xanthomonas arboricola]